MEIEEYVVGDQEIIINFHRHLVSSWHEKSSWHKKIRGVYTFDALFENYKKEHELTEDQHDFIAYLRIQPESMRDQITERGCNQAREFLRECVNHFFEIKPLPYIFKHAKFKVD